MGPARGQMPGRRRAASCYLPTLLPGIFLNFLPPIFSITLRQTLSYFLVVRRAVGPLAMAIKPNTCPLAFSPSDTVSFSGFFLPQPPPAFLSAADVPYIVLVARFHPFNYRLVEGVRVYMLNLGDSSRAAVGGAERGPPEALLPTPSPQRYTWVLPGLGCGGRSFPVWRQCFLYFASLLLFWGF